MPCLRRMIFPIFSFYADGISRCMYGMCFLNVPLLR
jgi:hypothetical protein